MFSENDINDINNIEDEWESFCDDEKAQREENNTGSCFRPKEIPRIESPSIPTLLSNDEITSSNLYISTTTIISYLNTGIDISSLFWKIPIIGYSSPTEGVIKKQMKFILNLLDPRF